MSWLARSIASLGIDDDGNEDDDHHHCRTTASSATTTIANNHSQYEHEEAQEHREEEEDEDEDRLDNQGRGVKEDLSEFRETLTRQLWGVASFLAPPPQHASTAADHQTDRSVYDRNRWELLSGQSDSGDVSDEDASDSVIGEGVRNDFSYIDGRFRSGISKFSNFLPFRSEDQITDAIGVTEEVLAFARNIAHHPETWLDFPLSEEEDMNDFDMSDAQCKHAMAVESLAPRLAALRIELCPAHMSDGYFWKVYFVLLHPRLNKHDAELLSTPQIVEARAMWMQELQKRTKPEPDWFGRSTFYSTESANSQREDMDPTSSDSPLGTSPFAPTTYYATADFPTEEHLVMSTEIPIIDKSVIEEEPVIKTKDKEFVAGPSYKVPVQDYEDDGDDWLEDNSELDGYSGTAIHVGTDEDVSFSDLEDNDDYTMPVKSKVVSKNLDASTKS